MRRCRRAGTQNVFLAEMMRAPWHEERIAETAAAHVAEGLLARTHGTALEELIATTLYHERLRLGRADGAERDEADRAFYGRIASELRAAHSTESERLLRSVVDHYAREVQGNFDWRVYVFATRALPVLLTALLHGVAPSRMLARVGHLQNIDDYVILEGEVERLRRLSRRGTVLLVPTHTSNLDSLIVGYAIFRMGLPPFMYGAGLNLFSNPVEGFFMRHLGAYTVDRRKTDPVYRDVLKEYATLSLERGQHNLFFPGGTRSRSGALETRLKRGLLGAGLTAFRRALAAGRTDPRFYVLPCTLTYPLVLEAATLIDDHLREEGKAKHILVGDEYGRIERWVDFMTGLMKLDVPIRVRIGSALDPIGNDVDAQGGSVDPRGRPVDPRRYLLVDGEIAEDAARDASYTTLLAERIAAAYRRDNVAIPTSVVAFAAFEGLRARSRHRELHRMLREASASPATLPFAETVATVGRIMRELRALEAGNAIRLSPEVRAGDAGALVASALRTFATYHHRAVLAREGDLLAIGDPQLLFYYRNRLDGYGLLDTPSLGARS
jgi:glycerol-3-phosphate O-acyltransferase